VQLDAHNQSTLRISPGAGRTIREIVGLLRQRGLIPTVSWHKRELFLPRANLTQACAALRRMPLQLDTELRQQRLQDRQAEESIVEGKRIITEQSKPRVARKTLNGFDGVDCLDKHQLSAVAVASHPKITGFCLFDEQGLGKTISTLFSFHRLREQGLIGGMLVLCPKNMVMEWERDASRFFGSRYRYRSVIGSAREKRYALDKKADVYITNFETASRLFLRLKELLHSQSDGFLLVVDESFYVKNTDALRTRAVRGLRQFATRCIVLCGTPAPNQPADIVEQVNIADKGAAFRGFSLPDDRERALPLVRDVLEERALYLRRRKREALPELPPKSFQQVIVPMSPIQSKLYTQALDAFVRDLEQTNERAFVRDIISFVAKRTRLLQLCSNPSGFVTDYRETPGKLLALDSILGELIEHRSEKVIIWCYFTVSLEAVLKRYDRFNPVRVDGKVASPLLRREAVRRFQEDDSTMLFVGNVAAAGAGITLHRARYALYESLSNQAAHYFQSIDRIHRRGQSLAVEYINLLCDQTIEVLEYEKLANKEEMARTLLSDPQTQTITRAAMLTEAREAAKLLGRPK
jgi:SNF2 family DNA or RNA helicase